MFNLILPNHLKKNLIIPDILISILLPLIIGAAIYIFFRPGSAYFLLFSANSVNHKPYLPDWVVYNLPDALWTFALISNMLIIWNRVINTQSVVWLILSLGVSLTIELTYGTFDRMDVQFIIYGAVIPVIINYLFKFISNLKNQ